MAKHITAASILREFDGDADRLIAEVIRLRTVVTQHVCVPRDVRYQCPECEEISEERRCDQCNKFGRRVEGFECPKCNDFVNAEEDLG